ncbi:hypothetical protein MNY64_17860 (plasmid) [Moellerella wisconsensis]|nr:hypothetical protein [Moellerella wisconsensis]UNH29314.1 hypothetical protein MNY64_17860 [Moellerella wisconsensis]
MKNKILLTILVSIGLSACSTNRLDAVASKEVPIERMYWESGRESSNGDSVIIVKRDSGPTYSACTANIFFQGTRVSELEPGEKVTMYVNSGEYVIGEFLSGAGCLPFLKTLVAVIKPNSNNVFRVKTTFMGANGGDALIRDNDISMVLMNSLN